MDLAVLDSSKSHGNEPGYMYEVIIDSTAGGSFCQMIRKTADNNSLQKVNRTDIPRVVYLSYLEDPAKYTICVYLAGSSVINNEFSMPPVRDGNERRVLGTGVRKE